ncbi:MAG: hypothetical protein ACOCWC_05735 [Bacteroidota bacterium]
MGNLIEKKFIIGEDKFHSEIILNRFGTDYNKDEFINKKAHLVYIDTSPPQAIITSAYLAGVPNERKPAFLDLYYCNDMEYIAKTRENLLKYCHLDTYAMVRILDILKAV